MIPAQTISLDNFEGPLDLLLHLIQKNEIDIYDIRIQTITEQFLGLLDSIVSTRVDIGAEFLGITSTLLLIKSQKLLPKHELLKEAIEDDPRFTLIQQLLEYCRFKEISTDLLEREEKESLHYPRGIYHLPKSKKDADSLPDFSITDLEAILHKLLNRQTTDGRPAIQDEPWQVADKIIWIKQKLSEHPQLAFSEVFTLEQSKDELIVTFLAILELMKSGQISVFKAAILARSESDGRQSLDVQNN